MASILVTGIIAIVGLIVLFYLYQYLFAASIPVVNIISAAQPGNKVGPVVTSLPPLYQGGQFTISTWVYVNTITANYNAPILVLGGTGSTSSFDTLRVYIGPNGQLSVRVGVTGANLPASDTTFTQIVTTSPAVPCDVPNINLQRWVCIVVALNGTLCDVYMDGKLVRSCTLANYFNVDTNPSLQITPAKKAGAPGFGGIISTTNVYGIALSPDEVYSNYKAGPEQFGNFYP